jgi:hypothetical protein
MRGRSTALFLCTLLLYSQLGLPLCGQQERLLLEDGTPIRLKLNQNLSSASARVDDRVDFEVLEEVRVGEDIVVPKGGIAWATVTKAQKKRRLGRGGHLDVNIDAVRLVTGERAALRAVRGGEGGGHVGAMTGAIVVTSLVFFPAAPFFLFMKGKDITIPKGTEVTAYINGDFVLNQARLRSAQPQTAEEEAAKLHSVSANVEVVSIPEGAEIEIDGAFVGNTPSMIELEPGNHLIVLRKKGYILWERTIRTSSGQVKITAELELSDPED